jgi:hypothetical protein
MAMLNQGRPERLHNLVFWSLFIQGSEVGYPRLNSLRSFSAKNLTGQAEIRGQKSVTTHKPNP